MKKYFLILMVILTIATVQATEESFIFEEGELVDIKVPCIENDYSLCSSSTNCTITIFYPDSSVLIDGENMTHNTNYFNYTITGDNLTQLGEYSSSVSCVGSDNGFTTFMFLVTPNGEEPTTGRAVFYGILFTSLMIFLVVAVSQLGKKEGYGWTVGLISFSYIMLVGILFVGWQIAENFLTSIPFISSILYIFWLISMIAFFPFIIILSFKLFLSMTEEGITKDLMKKGYSKEEARNIARKRKGK
jgi:hypothetical protein